MEALGQRGFELSFQNVVTLIEKWRPLILTILAVVIILPGLGAGSLRDWDEAIYAQVSREIIQSNNWITLQQGYQPYFEKPPLLMWSTAVFYKVFGINEFWSRATSALSGIILVLITYLAGKTIYGKWTGLLAGFILLSCREFVVQSRNGTTNVPLALFVFTGLFACLRLREGNQKWWYLVFASCGLAFMLKFWAGLVLPVILVIILFIDHKTSEALRSKHFWLGLLLAGMIVIPWHLLVYLQNGQAFLDIYVTRNLVERSLTPLDSHQGSSLYYLNIMRGAFSPWYFLVPFAVAIGIKETIGRLGGPGLLVIEILFILGLYTFIVSTKIYHYILPVYPALSILIAHVFVTASHTFKSYAFAWLITGALFAMTVAQERLFILCLCITVVLIIVIKRGLLSERGISRVVAAFVFTSFFMVSITGYILGNRRLDVGSVYGLQIAPVARISAFAGNLNPSRAEPLIGLAMPEDWGTSFAVEGPAAVFYSNRPVKIAGSWEELQSLMTEQETGEILIAGRYLDRLSKDFDVKAIKKIDPFVYARYSR